MLCKIKDTRVRNIYRCCHTVNGPVTVLHMSTSPKVNILEGRM